jgi:hypothetical protein
MLPKIMSFLLSSFQFDRKHMDHNSLLKSFRKSKIKTTIFVKQHPNSGLERFVLRFLYNTQWDTHTHTHTHTVGVLCTSDQPVVDAITDLTQQIQQTKIRALSLVRTRDLSNQAASDTNPIPYCYRGRRTIIYSSPFHRLPAFQTALCLVT